MEKMMLGAVAAVAFSASALAVVPPEQGGAGTVDPGSVNVREFVRFKLGEETTDTHYARHVADDAAGNRYVGSVLQPEEDPCCGVPFRSVITKFAPDGTPAWRRERLIRVEDNGNGTVTYFETFSPGQKEEVLGAADANSSLKLSSLATDPLGNVIATFDQYEEQSDPQRGQITVLSGRTLIVKFDANGQYRWRFLAPAGVGFDFGYAGQSLVRALDTSAPDGSVVVLIDNFYHKVPDQAVNHQSVVLKLAADGGGVFAVHYGINEKSELEYHSYPLALSRDGAGRVYVVSTESPDLNTRPRPDQLRNVIRQISPTGDLLRRVERPVTSGSLQGSDSPTHTWVTGRADDAGNFYVAGTHYRSFSSESDRGEANQLVLKFDVNLTEKWRALGPRPKATFGDPQVEVFDLALSADGVTVAGGTRSEDPVDQSKKDNYWEITRYGAEQGHVLWHRLYQGQAAPGEGFYDIGSSVEVDRQGNVYAAGSVSVPTGGSASALIKYANNGDLQFVKFFPDYARGFSTDVRLTTSTNRPIFVGETGDKEVAVIEFDNPPVVLAPPTLVGNISTRARVGTGDDALIGGFIVVGPPGSAKKVMLRAIGPSLSDAGVPGALPDTLLELHDSSGRVIANDDWKKSRQDGVSDAAQKVSIEATGIPPTKDAESALVATLPPGPCTVVVSGKGGAGVALVEVYDLEQGSTASLVNISTRGTVLSGDDVMIGGVILLGDNPRRVIIRAIGPSLAAAGVAGALQDTTLELRDSQGNEVAKNDDWKLIGATATTQEADIRGTGIPPADPRESSVVTVLYPGIGYTAIVRGKGGSTGVALVEVYRLQ